MGGRFNRPGVDALYLSRRIETATAEYQQDEPLMPAIEGRAVQGRGAAGKKSWDVRIARRRVAVTTQHITQNVAFFEERAA